MCYFANELSYSLNSLQIFDLVHLTIHLRDKLTVRRQDNPFYFRWEKGIAQIKELSPHQKQTGSPFTESWQLTLCTRYSHNAFLNQVVHKEIRAIKMQELWMVKLSSSAFTLEHSTLNNPCIWIGQKSVPNSVKFRNIGNSWILAKFTNGKKAYHWLKFL